MQNSFFRRKEKLHHCYAVAEAFSNPTIRISTSVPVLLEVTIEIFLKLCDDSDSDVRMTSDECLNRIIRVSLLTQIIFMYAIPIESTGSD